MADYQPTEIVDIIIEFGRNNENYRDCARSYALRFPNRRHPNNITIRSLLNRARHGRLRRERKKKDRTENTRLNTNIIRMVTHDPHVSQRTISRHAQTSLSTVNRVLRANHFHPYHIERHQALTEAQKRARVMFCQWGLQKLGDDNAFFDRVLFSDEASFHNTGTLNRHNCHYYSKNNPHWLRRIDHQHRWRVNVWCGILDGKIVGPHFFDGNLNGAIYHQFLQYELQGLMENINLRTVREMWFQHDGAPPHYAGSVRDYLDESFHRRWIGRNGFIRWPANSPDLTPCDFFLWGYVKDIVYAQAPTTSVDMKRRIRNAMAQIPEEMIRRTTNSVRERFRKCLNVEGDVFEH